MSGRDKEGEWNTEAQFPWLQTTACLYETTEWTVIAYDILFIETVRNATCLSHGYLCSFKTSTLQLQANGNENVNGVSDRKLCAPFVK